MTKPLSKQSQEQAANFHVLPKREATREQGRKPANDDVGNVRNENRDADAGALIGGLAEQVNQPTRTEQSGDPLVN